MKTEDKQRICDEMERTISLLDRFLVEDVLRPYLPTDRSPTIKETRTLQLLLWEARDRLRASGRVYQAKNGGFELAGWQGIERQAKRQRAAGQRKRVRAEQKLRLAAEIAPGKDAERLTEMADRDKLRNALAKRRMFAD